MPALEPTSRLKPDLLFQDIDTLATQISYMGGWVGGLILMGGWTDGGNIGGVGEEETLRQG